MFRLLKKKTFREYQLESKQLDIIEQKWALIKNNIIRKNAIKEEYEELQKKKKHKLTMSKKFIIFLLINCSIIEIFTGIITIIDMKLAWSIGIMPDFSPLVALIGAVVGEVIGLAVYFAKSTKENTEGGIVYFNATQGILNEEDAVG